MRPRAEAAGVPENLMTRVTDAIRQSIVENSANRYLTKSYTLASGRVRARQCAALAQPERLDAAAACGVVGPIEQTQPGVTRALAAPPGCCLH